MHKLLFFLLFACVFLPTPTMAQDASKIRLNQLGFYPESQKIAVIPDGTESDFSVVSIPSGEVVFQSKLTGPNKSVFSPKLTRIADFSQVTKPGSYRISVPGHGDSYQFEIKPNVFCGLTKALIKGFYFQRMSTPLLAEHAGKWSRAAGLLNEIAWNLRWMLTMQDPADGGVYNKVTNADFDGMVMPSLCVTPRYVVSKGTAATLDFAGRGVESR